MKYIMKNIGINTILIVLLLTGVQAIVSADSFAMKQSPDTKLTANALQDSLKDFQMAGNFRRYTKSKSIIEFQCTNSTVRFELCTSDIFRIRMSRDGKFKPNEQFVVIKYDWPSTKFSVSDKGEFISIQTERIQIKAFKSPFRFEFFDLQGNAVNKDWKEGSMGFRGDEIICRKELTGTDHLFGLGQRYEKSDLRGTKTTCLVTREYTPVPFYLGTDGYGIFFHNTWASEFDFTKNPSSFSAPGGGELDYYFIYGPDFKHIINQYSKITGFSPLPPKWAFGLFFSRWDEEAGGINYHQEGQGGMLRTIKAAREVWDWPLDGIRVHSMGPKQSFYASPNLNWPEMLWGAFPSVDTFVLKLHEQHIHPLFWEAPGITGNCKMYDEAVKNNYLLTKNGRPQDIVFGYLQPPGGMVDFLNPDARKWWGKYHFYMADFGSDGVAGDWNDEKMLKGTMSPYNGMGSAEFLNIYSLLFNQASWEAYKERMPNKRCINFGLVYWAGGQRYPMQGTQDSDAAGKIIFGEMMGCINLGLSGIPFRTFTDNVSRVLVPGLPFSRLSQYLSLTVAGERTLCTHTGIEMADRNYRFYGKLRYRLMPYIYTYAREATQTGTPMIRALVLENQNDPMAYEAYCEYLFGKDILIAPLWSDTTFYRDIYLPDGEWIDFFDEKIYKGKQTINYYAPIDRVPILIKAGAIIPMAPDNQHYIDEIRSPLTIQIYPKGKSSFELYEDDGVSYDYEKGIFSTITFYSEEVSNGLIIRKEAPVGNYNIPEKEFIICVHKKPGAKDITYNGSTLPHSRSKEEFNAVKAGWMQEEDGKELLWIKVDCKAADKFEIKVSY
jgi:alpha-glucosidase